MGNQNASLLSTRMELSNNEKRVASSQERKKRRKLRRKLFFKHHRGHWQELLRGTIPIFVAASINKVVAQLLQIMVGSGGVRIQLTVTFLYALLVAHTLGYIVCFKVSEDDPAADYYESLASDNASFAWSSCLTLVIMSWLYSDYPPVASIAAWVVLLILVLLFLYATNYLQEVGLELSIDIRRRLRDFESDCFALAAAYSVSVIIAASVYHNEATDYISHTDDMTVRHDFDDRYDQDSLRWLFFVYTALFTLGLVGYQMRRDSQRTRQAAQVVAEDLRAHNRSSSFSAGKGDEEQDRLMEARDEEVEEEVRGVRGALKLRLSGWLCPWDEDRLCLQSCQRFGRITVAYMAACAWHLWATLSFQEYFPISYGWLLAQCVFALLSTFGVALLMTVVTVKKELSGLAGLLDAPQVQLQLQQPLSATVSTLSSRSASSGSRPLSLSARLLAENEGLLYLSFGRLLVGWAWQSLFSATVSVLVPADLGSQSQRHGLVLVCEALLTAAIVYLGYRLELFWTRQEVLKQRRRSRSDAGDDDERSAQIDLIEGDERSTHRLSETLL